MVVLKLNVEGHFKGKVFFKVITKALLTIIHKGSFNVIVKGNPKR